MVLSSIPASIHLPEPSSSFLVSPRVPRVLVCIYSKIVARNRNLTPSAAAERAHRSSSDDHLPVAPPPWCSWCTPGSGKPLCAILRAPEHHRRHQLPRRRRTCGQSTFWLGPHLRGSRRGSWPVLAPPTSDFG
jgi:hypothetical protein